MTAPSHGRAAVVVADERSPHDSPMALIDLDRWRQLAEDALTAEAAVGELTLTFVDASEIASLNAEYMGTIGPTDVLSFPMDDDSPPGVPTLLGDVVISPAVAASQYAEHAGTFDDEIALLVVHGVLHVLGFDHAEVGQAAIMRRRELELLELHCWAGSAPVGFRQVHD